jgi:hypothetical protein
MGFVTASIGDHVTGPYGGLERPPSSYFFSTFSSGLIILLFASLYI